MRRSPQVYNMFDDIPSIDSKHDHNHDDYRQKFGPGHWDYMHRCAANAKTEQSKWFIVDMLHMECVSFGCSTCRQDFTILWTEKYYDKLDQYWNKYYKLNGKVYYVGMLYLTVDMHNDVNRKLFKPCMSYIDAINKYLIEDACDDYVCTDH